MARERTNVPPKLKEELREQAGGKCANPGCPATRTHLHHINEWAVYETHDGEHMIAICPNCHDDVHHGQLVITDETVYAWKHIKRIPNRRDLVYVDPGESSKFLLGTIAVTGESGVTVFELGDSTKLGFTVKDGDIMLVNLAVSTIAGDEVLRVVDGHVRHEAVDPVTYERVQGHSRVTAPLSEDFMPGWAVRKLRQAEPAFASDGRLTLLDLEVLEPGLVRVQGVWATQDQPYLVAVTTERLAFLHPGLPAPLALVGDGPDSCLGYEGPITASLFGFPDVKSLRRVEMIRAGVVPESSSRGATRPS
jgi:hypothetical protein